ncbi:hypothetical protein D3C71_1061690 [compost metagenome]
MAAGGRRQRTLRCAERQVAEGISGQSSAALHGHRRRLRGRRSRPRPLADAAHRGDKASDRRVQGLRLPRAQSRGLGREPARPEDAATPVAVLGLQRARRRAFADRRFLGRQQRHGADFGRRRGAEDFHVRPSWAAEERGTASRPGRGRTRRRQDAHGVGGPALGPLAFDADDLCASVLGFLEQPPPVRAAQT